MHLPGPIPVKNFWSVVVYDLWTRSMLANGQKHPSLNSYAPDVGDRRGRLGRRLLRPRATPRRGRANWIRTLPEIGWFPMLRLYGPEETWFDLTWKPGPLEPL